MLLNFKDCMFSITCGNIELNLSKNKLIQDYCIDNLNIHIQIHIKIYIDYL